MAGSVAFLTVVLQTRPRILRVRLYLRRAGVSAGGPCLRRVPQARQAQHWLRVVDAWGASRPLEATLAETGECSQAPRFFGRAFSSVFPVFSLSPEVWRAVPCPQSASSSYPHALGLGSKWAQGKGRTGDEMLQCSSSKT